MVLFSDVPMDGESRGTSPTFESIRLLLGLTRCQAGVSRGVDDRFWRRWLSMREEGCAIHDRLWLVSRSGWRALHGLERGLGCPFMMLEAIRP